MHEYGLPFQRLHERGLDGIDEKRAHRAIHFEIGRRHRRTALRVCHDNAREPLPQIREIRTHRKYRHHFGGYSDVEAALAVKTIELAATADFDVPQTLGAEIHRPAELYAPGVDIETLQPALGKPCVIVVALVLHAGVERHHGKIVRVGDGVDIASEPEREGSKRDYLCKAAACRRTLDVESRSAGRLAHATNHLLAETSETFHETERRSSLAFAKCGGRNGRHIDILALAPGSYAFEHLRRIDFGKHVAVRHPFVILETEFGSEVFRAPERRLGEFGNLPVFEFGWVEILHGVYYTIFSLPAQRRRPCVCTLHAFALSAKSKSKHGSKRRPKAIQIDCRFILPLIQP